MGIGTYDRGGHAFVFVVFVVEAIIRCTIINVDGTIRGGGRDVVIFVVGIIMGRVVGTGIDPAHVSAGVSDAILQ